MPAFWAGKGGYFGVEAVVCGDVLVGCVDAVGVDGEGAVFDGGGWWVVWSWVFRG